MFDNSSPNVQWVIVRRERDEFVKSCIKTSFMAQYSKDVAYWNNLGDKYDLRLADPKNTVSNVTELRTAEILSGDAGELKNGHRYGRIELFKRKGSKICGPKTLAPQLTTHAFTHGIKRRLN